MSNDIADTCVEPEIAMFEVHPSRLADGTYDYKRDRQIGRGDINASYSGDKIALEGRVKKPFRFGADSWVTVGMRGCGSFWQLEAYRLVAREIFSGKPTTYQERAGTAEASGVARNDPMGFYHGMMVKCGKELCVLSGPPARFVPALPDAPDSDPAGPIQLSLF
jgi:hypothetical protein